MKFFSECSGECCVCKLSLKDSRCIAGHGDNDYIKASKEQVINQIDKNMYKNQREIMIEYLKKEYCYNYHKGR